VPPWKDVVGWEMDSIGAKEGPTEQEGPPLLLLLVQVEASKMQEKWRK